MSRNILIIGATSAVAQATARLFVKDKSRMLLVGRNGEKLESVKNDLRTRGAEFVETGVYDALEFSRHEELLDEALQTLGSIDVVLVAHGSLPDQKKCESDFALAEREIKANFLSIVSLLTPISNYFEERNAGVIAVISSVAGDRGRMSNYVYGCAKGGLSIFLQGLRNRLHRVGVHVLTIKLGFVDTPMTAHISKGPLFVKPQTVAKGIYRAIDKRYDTVYLPSFWRMIMMIIALLPESVFKRLKL